MNAIVDTRLDTRALIDYLASHEKKSMLRFLTCGSVDDGKSTLIGRLLYDTKLIFEDQPLSAVIEEFNRYTRVPIVLSDASLPDLRVNAVFHTTNVDSLLRFLSRIDHVRIDRSPEEIRIVRSEVSASPLD